MRAEALIDLKDVAKKDSHRKQQRLQAVPGGKADYADHTVSKTSWAKMIMLLVMMSCLSAAAAYGFNAFTNMFVIEHVKIKGAFHNEQAHQVRGLLLPYLQRDLLTVDLESAHKALLSLAWLRQARLQREWPNQVLVHIEEHVPVAHWNPGELISADGQVFKQAYSVELNKLPHLQGPAGTEQQVLQHYSALSALLQKNNMTIQSLVLDQRNSWELKVNNGIFFRLGAKHIEERLAGFLNVLANEPGLVLENIKSIDLRHSNGFAVGWKTPQSTQQGKRSA